MKLFSSLILLVPFVPVFGQADTLQIIKIDYVETTIPAGYVSYLVANDESYFWFEEIGEDSAEFDSVLIIEPNSRLKKKLLHQIRKSASSEQKIAIVKPRAIIFVTCLRVVCTYEVISDTYGKRMLIRDVEKIYDNGYYINIENMDRILENIK